MADTLAIFNLSNGPTAAIMIVAIAIPIALNSLSLNVRGTHEDRLHCYLALLTHV